MNRILSFSALALLMLLSPLKASLIPEDFWPIESSDHATVYFGKYNTNLVLTVGSGQKLY